MKVGLYTVSYGGLWYNGDPLSVEDVILRAKKIGFDGIEICAKRPFGFPLDWDSDKRKSIREFAKSNGIEIIALGAHSNFVRPVLEDRENELLMLSEQIKLARDLGTKILRIFIAWPGITKIDGVGNYAVPRKYAIDGICPGPDASKLQQWTWAKDIIKEGLKIAEKHGICLAIQNHDPFIMHKELTYLDMLDMVKEIDSEHLKCVLDCPLLKYQDENYVAQAVKDVGRLNILTHFGGEFKRDRSGKVVFVPEIGTDTGVYNYPVFLKALRETGYDDYVVYELCHPVLTEQHELAGLEKVDEQVQLAHEYIRNLLKEIY